MEKIVSHTYLSLENDREQTIDTYEEELENSYDLTKNLESCDLRDLKNNYFTEENPERFTHWELTYNNYFKMACKITFTHFYSFKIVSNLNSNKI